MSTKKIAHDTLQKIQKVDDRLFYLKSITLGASLNEQVMAFHKMYGASIRKKAEQNLSDVSDEEIAMRINLVAEEFREWLDAFGVDYHLEFIQKEEVFDDSGSRYEIIGSAERIPAEWVPSFRNKINEVEVADASADMKYVLEGSDITFGIPSVLISQEVHCSNMTKLGEDGLPIYREDGKVLKGPYYTKPNLKKVIEDHNETQ